MTVTTGGGGGGGGATTVTVTDADVAVVPPLVVAFADSAYVPAATLLQVAANGAALAVAINVEPLK